MATSKGVIQGYTTVAAVDIAHQVIVAAVAHGPGSEQSTLVPSVRLTDVLREPETLITADAGYHSKFNLKELHDRGIPALVADNLMRRRDERFANHDKYKALPDPLANKGAPAKTTKLFGPKNFIHARPTTSASLQRASICTATVAIASPREGSVINSPARWAVAERANWETNACGTPSERRCDRCRSLHKIKLHPTSSPSA